MELQKSISKNYSNINLKPKQIQLVQINIKYGDQVYLPYSVGILQSYVNQNKLKPITRHFCVNFLRRLSDKFELIKTRAKNNDQLFIVICMNESTSFRSTKLHFRFLQVDSQKISSCGGEKTNGKRNNVARNIHNAHLIGISFYIIREL